LNGSTPNPLRQGTPHASLFSKHAVAFSAIKYPPIQQSLYDSDPAENAQIAAVRDDGFLVLTFDIDHISAKGDCASVLAEAA
jgi:hypothetical protein